MIKIYIKFFILPCAAICVIALSIFFVFNRRQERTTQVNAPTNTLKKTPPLYISGTHLYQSDNHRPIRLRGVTSDYFRFAPPFKTHPILRGIDKQLTLTSSLLPYGINFITFYLSDTNKILENIDELDKYIEFADKNRMYVAFMPVARDYIDASSPNHSTSRARLEHIRLLEFISDRYKDHNNILYGIGAENETLSADEWNALQLELAQIIRKNNPDSIILITPYESRQLDVFLQNEFPLKNCVYFGDNYPSRDDKYAAEQVQLTEKAMNDTMNYPKLGLPVIIGEFGGNWARDFSSSYDLLIIRRMLYYFENNGVNYSMYRFTASFSDDQLALFDIDGQPTLRGKLYMDILTDFQNKK